MDLHICIVDNIPGKLLLTEGILVEPTLLEVVEGISKLRPHGNVLQLNYLRSLGMEYGRQYDEKFNVFRHIVPSNHVGTPYETNEDISLVLREMLSHIYPQWRNIVISKQLRSLPFGINTVYTDIKDIQSIKFPPHLNLTFEHSVKLSPPELSISEQPKLVKKSKK